MENRSIVYDLDSNIFRSKIFSFFLSVSKQLENNHGCRDWIVRQSAIHDTNNGIDEKQIEKFNHNSALDCDNSSIMKKMRTHFFDENITTITQV
jgi:hypothetical protein